MSDEIMWKNPPERRMTSKSGARKQFVEVLKSRPGEWAEFGHAFRNANTASTSAIQFRQAFPGVEAVSRNCRVYVRWVGEVSK